MALYKFVDSSTLELLLAMIIFHQQRQTYLQQLIEQRSAANGVDIYELLRLCGPLVDEAGHKIALLDFLLESASSRQLRVSLRTFWCVTNALFSRGREVAINVRLIVVETVVSHCCLPSFPVGHSLQTCANGLERLPGPCTGSTTWQRRLRLLPRGYGGFTK